MGAGDSQGNLTNAGGNPATDWPEHDRGGGGGGGWGMINKIKKVIKRW